ncbi:hypothetical protein JRO89_XSUnG0219700 [Xanthoceras sorbifolium]|uniref:NB-ARC domain-containing protein n=1 Tax=Xanthoceras sorbifolium TaxID=99658 RepID=A0ABQ8GX02_9ROSI|nr:hypothetical protein JRO89_XSUnG0219700 [Xanthoceras sorbifolium]
MVASIMGTMPLHQLSGLTEDDCWSLFKERAFRHEIEERPNLVALGKKIVKKCGGVPLAIKSLGSMMMYKRDEIQWLSVVESELWNLPQPENSILPALRLSYSNLPSKLRQCFVFCAIFPKDFVIEKEFLIQLWMASGFIPFIERLDLEDIGNEFCNELCWRSFLEDLGEDGFGFSKGFKMHDLVHNLAHSIMELPKHMNRLKNLRHLYLDRCEELSQMPPKIGQITCLKTLTCFIVNKKRGCCLDELKDLNLGGIIHIKHLQSVENLHDTKEANLVEKGNVCKLYLSWTNYYDEDDDNNLPSQEHAEKVLEALKPHANLKEFRISGYNGAKFPFWMGHNILNYVVTIELIDCHNCSQLPPLALLPSLRTLHLCSMSKVMYIDYHFQSGGTTRGFASVQSLTIKDLPSLQRFSRGGGKDLLPCLVFLEITKCPKLTWPHLPAVEQLKVSECNEVVLGSTSNLKSLISLSVSSNSELNYLPHEGIQHLSCLETLTLFDCPELVPLPNGIKYLTSLHKLQLSGPTKWAVSALQFLSISYCPILASLPHWLGDLTSLQTLRISSCPELTSLPASIQGLTKLQKLDIFYCPKLVKRCEKETGEDWYKISHIPYVNIY